jgi:hypothetical protein
MQTCEISQEGNGDLYYELTASNTETRKGQVNLKHDAFFNTMSLMLL